MRWLTADLGTAAATDPAVGEVADAAVVDVRDLVDREGNRSGDIRAKIDEGLAYLASGRRVIVCCDHGMSRSNAVATGILAVSLGVTVDEAMQTLSTVDSVHEIKLDVLDAVRQAVDKGTPPNPASGAVLITGASGFVGSRLVAALHGTMEVVPLAGTVDLRYGAVPLESLVRRGGVSTVVHLAHPRVVTSNESIADAVAMIKTVIDVCSVTNARLVYISGWEVFSGYRDADMTADESLCPRPASSYGQAKALCETLVRYAIEARGLNACTVRVGPTFGEGGVRPRFLTAFVRHAQRGEPIVTHVYNNGRPALDLIHIDDVADGLTRVLSNDVSGVFQLGTGATRTTYIVADIVRNALGADVAIEERSIDANVTNVAMKCDRAVAELGWAVRRDVPTELAILAKMIANRREAQ